MDKTLFAQHDIDIDALLSRCMNNEAFAKKFLVKFINDDNFHKIKAAAQTKDAEKMLAAAHTLKGVSGNLSLTSIYRLSGEICDHLRNDEIDKAIACLKQLELNYTDVVHFLQEQL